MPPFPEAEALRKQSLIDRDRSAQDLTLALTLTLTLALTQDVAWAEEIQQEATRKLDEGRTKFESVKRRLEESQARCRDLETQLAAVEAEKAAALKHHADEAHAAASRQPPRPPSPFPVTRTPCTGGDLDAE